MTGEVRSLNVKLSCKYPFLIKFIELLSLTFTDFLSLFKVKSIKERSPSQLNNSLRLWCFTGVIIEIYSRYRYLISNQYNNNKVICLFNC